ncbi:DUF1349 domain-containing protein [Dactylosporangium sp. NPDC049742]|uniref:DUF1349 domain-containing protein n=1 Tax=Dactylosporangium sp. NPDC049742 TaxID=3154737 RepID=UPI0034413E6F
MDDLVFDGVPLRFRASGPRTAPAPVPVAGGLRVSGGPGADLFLDPAGGSSRPDAERFTARVDGDFQLSAHVEPVLRDTFDSAVLLAWIDDENWCKICAELDPEGIPRVVTVVTRAGASDDANGWPYEGSGIHLRISRMGSVFALHTSGDGVTWQLARVFALPLAPGAPVEAGLLVQSPRGPGTTADFSAVRFARTRLADLRDGS